MAEHALMCANHPDRETTLRCNRCEKPICTQCAVLTPVGYRCAECIRGQQAVFETAQRYDLAIGGILSAIGTGLAVFALRALGYWGFFVAPILGGGLAEVIRWAVRRRRSRRLPMVAAIGGALGVLANLAMPLMNIVGGLAGGASVGIASSRIFAVLWPLVYGVLMVSTLYYRLRGIRL
ncbi:MAG: B-box zinc finger protein [Anaerolineales bacterium]|jgi:hypothetical protein